MKKIGFIVLLLVSSLLIAQKNEQGKHLLLDKKLAFLREKLLLNDQEFDRLKQEFMSFEKQRWELFRKKRSILRDVKPRNSASLPDKEILEKIKELQNTEKDLFELRRQYMNRLMQILPPRKVLKYWQADMQFNRILLKKRREKNRNRKK